MPDAIRKVIYYLVAAFLIFYMITQPHQFAGVVKDLGGAVGTGAHRIGQFFTSLIS
ncbi:MAG: hypothetical protein ACRDP1_07550 [Nocardioidaceae bacterium]